MAHRGVLRWLANSASSTTCPVGKVAGRPFHRLSLYAQVCVLIPTPTLPLGAANATHSLVPTCAGGQTAVGVATCSTRPRGPSASPPCHANALAAAYARGGSPPAGLLVGGGLAGASFGYGVSTGQQSSVNRRGAASRAKNRNNKEKKSDSPTNNEPDAKASVPPHIASSTRIGVEDPPEKQHQVPQRRVSASGLGERYNTVRWTKVNPQEADKYQPLPSTERAHSSIWSRVRGQVASWLGERPPEPPTPVSTHVSMRAIRELQQQERQSHLRQQRRAHEELQGRKRAEAEELDEDGAQDEHGAKTESRRRLPTCVRRFIQHQREQHLPSDQVKGIVRDAHTFASMCKNLSPLEEMWCTNTGGTPHVRRLCDEVLNKFTGISASRPSADHRFVWLFKLCGFTGYMGCHVYYVAQRRRALMLMQMIRENPLILHWIRNMRDKDVLSFPQIARLLDVREIDLVDSLADTLPAVRDHIMAVHTVEMEDQRVAAKVSRIKSGHRDQRDQTAEIKYAESRMRRQAEDARRKISSFPEDDRRLVSKILGHAADAELDLRELPELDNQHTADRAVPPVDLFAPTTTPPVIAAERARRQRLLEEEDDEEDAVLSDEHRAEEADKAKWKKKRPSIMPVTAKPHSKPVIVKATVLKRINAGEKGEEGVLSILAQFLEPWGYVPEYTLRRFYMMNSVRKAPTPDVVLVVPIVLHGRKVHWIDSKSGIMMPGLSPDDKVKQFANQMERYVAAFGPGMVVWHKGYNTSVFDVCPPEVMHVVSSNSDRTHVASIQCLERRNFLSEEMPASDLRTQYRREVDRVRAQSREAAEQRAQKRMKEQSKRKDRAKVVRAHRRQAAARTRHKANSPSEA